MEDSYNPYFTSPGALDFLIELHYTIRLYPNIPQQALDELLNSQWNISFATFRTQSAINPPADTLGPTSDSDLVPSTISITAEPINDLLNIKITLQYSDIAQDNAQSYNLRLQLFVVPRIVMTSDGIYTVLGIRRSFDYSIIGSQDIKQVVSQANVAGLLSLSSTSMHPAVVQGLIMVASADPTGISSSFIQSVRFINKLLYINFDFGALLTLFLEQCEKGSGIPKVSAEVEQKLRRNYRYKLSRYRVDLSISHLVTSLRSIIYTISWLLHLSVLRIRRIQPRIPTLALYFVYYMPAIHMSTINLTIIEVSYFPVRTLLHSNNIIHNLISVVYIIMMSVDFVWLTKIIFKDSLWSVLYYSKLKSQNELSALHNLDRSSQKEKTSIKPKNTSHKSIILEAKPAPSLFSQRESVRNIDYKNTYRQIELAELQILARVSVLKFSQATYGCKVCRAEHILLLFRTVLFHATLIINQVWMMPPVFLLLFFDLTYALQRLKLYFKIGHLNSIFILLLRQLQVWTMISFYSIFLSSKIIYGDKATLSITLQRVSIWLIIVSLLAQYVLMILNLLLIIIRSIKNFIDMRKLRLYNSKRGIIVAEHKFLRYVVLSKPHLLTNNSKWAYKRRKESMSQNSNIYDKNLSSTKQPRKSNHDIGNNQIGMKSDKFKFRRRTLCYSDRQLLIHMHSNSNLRLPELTSILSNRNISKENSPYSLEQLPVSQNSIRPIVSSTKTLATPKKSRSPA